MQGCTFDKKGTHVQARGDVKSAILTGNQAEGGFRTDNQAGRRLQAVANEQPDA